jgi:hypothetical protein
MGVFGSRPWAAAVRDLQRPPQKDQPPRAVPIAVLDAILDQIRGSKEYYQHAEDASAKWLLSGLVPVKSKDEHAFTLTHVSAQPIRVTYRLERANYGGLTGDFVIQRGNRPPVRLLFDSYDPKRTFRSSSACARALGLDVWAAVAPYIVTFVNNGCLRPMDTYFALLGMVPRARAQIAFCKWFWKNPWEAGPCLKTWPVVLGDLVCHGALVLQAGDPVVLHGYHHSILEAASVYHSCQLMRAVVLLAVVPWTCQEMRFFANRLPHTVRQALASLLHPEAVHPMHCLATWWDDVHLAAAMSMRACRVAWLQY